MCIRDSFHGGREIRTHDKELKFFRRRHLYVDVVVLTLTHRHNAVRGNRTGHVLSLRGCVTPSIPSRVCLLRSFSLLLSCAGRVKIEDSSFIPFRTIED